MATRVFISWSGELSRRVGHELYAWLPRVIQSVRPYFTPEDIQKGAKWSSEIAAELAAANIGIFCLTRENTAAPWINFEAGALSKSIEKGRVCTLLFGIEPTDFSGPLVTFQATRFVKDDVKKLLGTINAAESENRLEPKTLDEVFDVWWPQLELSVKEIMGSHRQADLRQIRSEREMLEELLELVRASAARPARISPLARRRLIEVGHLAKDLDRIFPPNTGGSEVIEELKRRVRALAQELGMVALPPARYVEGDLRALKGRLKDLERGTGKAASGETGESEAGEQDE